MKWPILAAVILLGFVHLDAQNRVMSGPGGSVVVGGSPIMPNVAGYVNGQPLYVMNGTETEGSPYFNDEWANGVVAFKSGKKIDWVRLKLSLYDGQLYYLENGVSHIFLDSLDKLTLRDSLKNTSLDFRIVPLKLDDNLSNTFMEVLADGRIQLLKFEKRTIEDYKDVSQAVHHRFKTSTEYYLVVDNGPIQKIKLSKDAFFNALGSYGDNARKIQEQDKTRLKSEASFSEMVKKLNQSLSAPLKAF